MLSATGLLAGSESDKAGPLGLLTIVALGIAVYFLYRSMVRHVNKVPASFDRPAGTPAPGTATPRESGTASSDESGTATSGASGTATSGASGTGGAPGPGEPGAEPPGPGGRSAEPPGL